MISTIYLNIGSNSGDRRAFIARAVAALRAAFGHALRISRPVESEPWGFGSANRFLNIGVAIDLHRTAPWQPAELEALLGTTQAIERAISPHPHRNPDGTYADREIDIDIVAVDTIVYTSPRLTLPHPAMHLRPFVLAPMAELAPSWHHPALALTPSALLTRCGVW